MEPVDQGVQFLRRNTSQRSILNQHIGPIFSETVRSREKGPKNWRGEEGVVFVADQSREA
jgi:hypothetical protein